MQRLHNTIMEYSWGSTTALADFLGAPSPNPCPQAELWMGAHPMGSSRLGQGSAAPSLIDRIRDDPEGTLGASVAERFGGEFPFLLKLLAAEEPLSLQAHPSKQQAVEGFAREEAAGTSRSASTRCYRDNNPKPEVLYALSPFQALCGFRPRAETLELLVALEVRGLGDVHQILHSQAGPTGLRAAFVQLLATPEAEREMLVAELVAACRRISKHSGQFRGSVLCALKLADRYPADIGVVASLFLNLVKLEPGQAIELPAGNLHSYLRGFGVELMANSDNVLRGGLTAKHVDAGELARVLHFEEGPARLVQTQERSAEETECVTGAEEFSLRILRPRGGVAEIGEREGPELLLCIEESIVVRPHSGDDIALQRGESLFVAASDGHYGVSGDGALVRAVVGHGT